ncbi:MAG: hypothetical protein GF332_04570 [Candidatus Moranbacteria bacterium]|nr:hypothetical protein [Candidatus Moranbacteria bacterium]
MNIKIKLCGFTNFEDVKQAVDLKVDYLGFIVNYDQSPRNITLKKLKFLLKKIKLYKTKYKKPKIVLILINQTENKIYQILNQVSVNVIQFHGKETPELCKKLKKQVEVWKVFNPDDKYEQVIKYKKNIDKFLLDASRLKDKQADQNVILKDTKLIHNLQNEKQFVIIAGGLNQNNIIRIIKKFKPNMVDISSGIEISPGRKSKEKIKKIIKLIKKQ